MNVALLALVVGCCHLPTSESASANNADSKWGDADQAHRYLLPERDFRKPSVGIGLGNRGKNARGQGSIVKLPNTRRKPIFPNRRSSTLEYFPEDYTGRGGNYATPQNPLLLTGSGDEPAVRLGPKGHAIRPGDGIRVGGLPSHITSQGMKLLHNDPMPSQGIGIGGGSNPPSANTDQEGSPSNPTNRIDRPAAENQAEPPKPRVGVEAKGDSTESLGRSRAK